MFGLSLGGQLIQGSAERTWNCISQIANLLWYKFNNIRQPIMPRQRRRHHSRSKSRSRSHSHDKERDAKRRKIEAFDSPNHKRSVSPEDSRSSNGETLEIIKTTTDTEMGSSNKSVENASDMAVGKVCDTVILTDSDSEASHSNSKPESEPSRKPEAEPVLKPESEPILNEKSDVILLDSDSDSKPTTPTNQPRSRSQRIENRKSKTTVEKESLSGVIGDIDEDPKTPSRKEKNGNSSPIVRNASSSGNVMESTTPISNNVKKLAEENTPNKRLTPKQIQKKIESEKKRLQREKEREEREKQKEQEREEREKQKEKEREEREKQKQDEKEKKEAERLKKKEQKQKEMELKQKEKEEKEEQKKREKELRRLEKDKKEKEKEEEKLRRQQELEEKNKEKLKEEEKKQKAAAAFVSFFVPKKTNSAEEKRAEETILAFMPFEVKSDMKLPPPRRKPMTQEEKNLLINILENNRPDQSYLTDLKSTKPRSCPRTWPCQASEDDIEIIEGEELLGQTICEEKPKTERMRAKYLKFHQNQRPAYYGTWRKKSKYITGRKPFGKETIFDYEVDSDDDWEEEEQGENLEVISDDDKENEPENEDYEVDNEFFVPHGHLSDDEVDDEENARLSPESQKQKLKLLKDAFDEDIRSKTHKIKPRSIGCIWYDRDGKNVDEAIDRYLRPLSVIISKRIEIMKRDLGSAPKKNKLQAPLKDIPENLMHVLVKLVHGNTIKRKYLVDQFANYIQNNHPGMEISKANISRHIAFIAKWSKNVEMKRKFCWMVNKDIGEKYNIDLVLPNAWDSVKDIMKV